MNFSLNLYRNKSIEEVGPFINLPQNRKNFGWEKTRSFKTKFVKKTTSFKEIVVMHIFRSSKIIEQFTE